MARAWQAGEVSMSSGIEYSLSVLHRSPSSSGPPLEIASWASDLEALANSNPAASARAESDEPANSFGR
jgi:hypothetical protein